MGLSSDLQIAALLSPQRRRGYAEVRRGDVEEDVLSAQFFSANLCEVAASLR
jgi:hypothetical protein